MSGVDCHHAVSFKENRIRGPGECSEVGNPGRPSFSAHVRWGERGAPVWSCGTRQRLEGETDGIPHLAKNERDVEHPSIGRG